jgi:hypothetical protein
LYGCNFESVGVPKCRRKGQNRRSCFRNFPLYRSLGRQRKGASISAQQHHLDGRTTSTLSQLSQLACQTSEEKPKQASHAPQFPKFSVLQVARTAMQRPLYPCSSTARTARSHGFDFEATNWRAKRPRKGLSRIPVLPQFVKVFRRKRKLRDATRGLRALSRASWVHSTGQ